MKRRELLKALLVLPIVPINFVASNIQNAELKAIIKEFEQAGYKVTKHRYSWKNRLNQKTYFNLHDKDDSSFVIGMFEKIDKILIRDLNSIDWKYPKESEIGTYIFGNLEGDLPEQFHHLFSHIEDW